MIAIVILNWNGADMLRRFLPTVISTSHAEGEVIVADNGSTDESLAVLRKDFPEVRLVEMPKNLGFAEGYNEALRRIEQESPQCYDYYLLLNSDVRTTEGWLTPLLHYMEAHPEVAAAQPKLRAEWDPRMLEYAGACGGYMDRDGYPYCRGRLLSVVEEDRGQYDRIAPIFWASGAALLIRAKDWHDVGGLDGRFFAHNEEIDLCWRLRARGRSIVCIPESVVYHVGGGTLPQDSPRKVYLNFRNNLTMLYKNLPEKELRSVMRRRWWLDQIAALQFLAKGQVAHARAVWRARRDYAAWLPDFQADRQLNLDLATGQPIPERSTRSLLWAFFVRGAKTFAQFSAR